MPDRKLFAGAATANITPALGCSLAGGMTDRIGTDVHDELHVRSLVLDNGQARLAFAVADSCAIPREVIDRAKQAIHGHTAIPVAHILVSATHTHSAPPAAHLFQSPPDPRYQEFMTQRIADAVRLAVNRLEPARVGWGSGREESLVFNRRFFMKPGSIPTDPFGRTTDQVLMNPGAGNASIVKPAGPVDPDVSVLVVESAGGEPISMLASYALHYVGGEGPGQISADYFAVWAGAIQRLTGKRFVPILTNGCSGNINNVDVRGPSVRRPPYEQMQRVSEALAAECLRTWRGLQFYNWVELKASTEELILGVRRPSPEEVRAAREMLATVSAGGQYRDRSHIYARETLYLASYPEAVPTPVQAMRIGALGIATFPGEAFVELGLEVKQKGPFKPTFLIELANDYRGYVPTVEGHELGGYETWRAKSSFLEKDAAPRMVASALRQLGKLA